MPRKFYRELGKQPVQTEKATRSARETKQFWQNILEQEVDIMRMPNGPKNKSKNSKS